MMGFRLDPRHHKGKFFFKPLIDHSKTYLGWFRLRVQT